MHTTWLLLPKHSLPSTTRSSKPPQQQQQQQ
jgi:hypothetical protein